MYDPAIERHVEIKNKRSFKVLNFQSSLYSTSLNEPYERA